MCLQKRDVHLLQVNDLYVLTQSRRVNERKRALKFCSNFDQKLADLSGFRSLWSEQNAAEILHR